MNVASRLSLPNGVLAESTRVRAESARVTCSSSLPPSNGARPLSSPPATLVAATRSSPAALPMKQYWASQTVSSSVQQLRPDPNVHTSYSRSLSPQTIDSSSFSALGVTATSLASTSYGSSSHVKLLGTRSPAGVVQQEDSVTAGKVYAASSKSNQRSTQEDSVTASKVYAALSRSNQGSTQEDSVTAGKVYTASSRSNQRSTQTSPFAKTTYSRPELRDQTLPQSSARPFVAPSTAYSAKRYIPGKMRSQSPPGRRSSPQLIECRAMLATATSTCSLQLAPDASVDEAVSQATRQVLRNVVESRGALGPIGEHLSVSVLPSANGATTVHEWAQRNLGQAPMVVVKSDESEWQAPRRVEAGQEESGKRIQQAQSQMITTLQKLLQGQAWTIERQAAFIDDLQEREKQMSQLITKTIVRVKVDIATLQGDMLEIEEDMMTESGKAN